MTYSKAELTRRLTLEDFPRSATYDPVWMLENLMGPNAIWLAESLSEVHNLPAGSRVLDLGCGKAISSIFLAQEFQLQVWATDLWISAHDNWQRICTANLQLYSIFFPAASFTFQTKLIQYDCFPVVKKKRIPLETRSRKDDYLIFKNAVRFVAYDVGIRESWVSDNIGDFLTMAGPIPKGKLWRKFGRRLEVYIPPAAFILAHKLVAGRRKDAGDTVALFETLQIRTRKQAQKVLDTYIEKEVQQEHGVQETLDGFFPG